MRINIPKLKAKGFDVHIEKDMIEINPQYWMPWEEFKDILKPFHLHDAFINELQDVIHKFSIMSVLMEE